MKILQEKLITRGYSVGSYGADGDFGEGTYNAVVKFQKANGLEADGIVGSKTMYVLNANPSGTLLSMGSKGEEVRNLQEKLIARGYSVGSYGADGDFGEGTYNAVVKFQKANGLEADGIVGQATWTALGTENTLLRLGSKGSEVLILQETLIRKGYSVGSYGADGDFGQRTYDAVVQFQREHGLEVDGIVGPETWIALNELNDWNPGVGGISGVRKFLDIVKSQVGVKETPINITPYGAWYGMNGVAWCAIFVSWCANKAGILGTVVPKFHWCANAVNWFKARGRYMVRGFGTPKPGDIIFFYTGSNGFYHVGVVNYVKNGIVHTVEGNASDSVQMRSYSINDTRIHGYGINGGTNLGEIETGKERIVISGSEYYIPGGNLPVIPSKEKYKFISTAIKQLIELKNKYPNDKISWFISNLEYNSEDFNNFKETAKKIGVEIYSFNSTEGLIEYINTDRSYYKISSLIIFSHGVEGSIEFGYRPSYLGGIISKFSFTIDDIKKINQDVFANNAFIHLYSCNGATKNSNGLSFAEECFKRFKCHVKAAVNKTNYGTIYGRDTELDKYFEQAGEKGYLDTGSYYYPSLSEEAYWMDFI